LVTTYHTLGCYISENNCFQSHHRENIKPRYQQYFETQVFLYSAMVKLIIAPSLGSSEMNYSHKTSPIYYYIF
jgi:hypothetical protein